MDTSSLIVILLGITGIGIWYGYGQMSDKIEELQFRIDQMKERDEHQEMLVNRINVYLEDVHANVQDMRTQMDNR